MSNSPVAKVWLCPSKSKPNKPPYQVLLHTDGELTCDCPVWIFNRRGTQPRSCSHTEYVHSGQAGEPDSDYGLRPTFQSGAELAEKNAERDTHRVFRNLGDKQAESNLKRLARLKKLTRHEDMLELPQRKVNW